MVPHPGGLLGVAGRFPPKYMGGVFAGQALGGIFASVTNVVMFTLGAEPVWGAFFCFLVAVLFLFSALVCYLAVAKTEFYQVSSFCDSRLVDYKPNSRSLAQLALLTKRITH